MKNQAFNPSPSVAPDVPRVALEAVPNEGGGLSTSPNLPACECYCCGYYIRAGEGRICNPKTLRHLSKRVNGEITGVICLACRDRMKATRNWAVSGGVSVMTYTLKKISDGQIPHNIASVFEDLANTKAQVEKDIKTKLNILDRLTAEYTAMQSGWITVRKAYADYLWASYPERRKRANRAISQQEIRVMVFGRDNYRCRLCPSGENLQVDHIIPVAAGGSNEPDNLQTLCRSCNCSKGARPNPLPPAANAFAHSMAVSTVAAAGGYQSQKEAGK
jgi:5-methylcytosine-specific restriction enzyme A